LDDAIAVVGIWSTRFPLAAVIGDRGFSIAGVFSEISIYSRTNYDWIQQRSAEGISNVTWRCVLKKAVSRPVIFIIRWGLISAKFPRLWWQRLSR